MVAGAMEVEERGVVELVVGEKEGATVAGGVGEKEVETVEGKVGAETVVEERAVVMAEATGWRRRGRWKRRW